MSEIPSVNQKDENSSSKIPPPLKGHLDGPPPLKGYLDGCFDIMHSGHYNAIRQAKSVCDFLVLGIHSDNEIRQHKKSPPVFNEIERFELIKHIKWVDRIEYNVPYTCTVDLLEKIDCDMAIHGDDMPLNKDGRNAYEEIIEAQRMKIVKRTEGVSTTDFVNKLINLHKNENGKSKTESESINFIFTARRVSEFFNSGRTVEKMSRNSVVYCPGCFDMFHIGHAKFLEKAKEEGDYLIVGVYDDDLCKQIKGHDPIMSLYERVLNVLSCKYVNDVVISCPLFINEIFIHTLDIKKVVENKKFYENEMAGDFQMKFSGRNSVAESLGVFKELDVKDFHYLNTKYIAKRVADNIEIYKERNEKKNLIQQNYYKQKSKVPEI